MFPGFSYSAVCFTTLLQCASGILNCLTLTGSEVFSPISCSRVLVWPRSNLFRLTTSWFLSIISILPVLVMYIDPYVLGVLSFGQFKAVSGLDFSPGHN
jgi:hypothetical protein